MSYNFNSDSYNSDYDSYYMLVYKLFKTKYGEKFRFYTDKGFRLYNIETGVWELISLENTRMMVCEIIQNKKGLESKITNKIDNLNFWNNFINWFKIYKKTELFNENSSLIGFKNCTIDLNTMQKKNKNLNNHCLQSIDADFTYTIPNSETFKFFMEITSNKIYALNVLRALIKIALIDDQNLEIIFYLIGIPGSAKTIFWRYLKFLTSGNSTISEMSFWSTNAGKINGFGASFYFFQDGDYSIFTKKNVSELKRLCSHLPIYVGNPPNLIKGGQVFMSASSRLSYDQFPFLLKDDQWRRKVLFFPISQEKNNARSEKIYQNLVQNTDGIVAWALSLPDECLNQISNTGEEISYFLEKGVLHDDLNWSALQFFVFRVRLEPSHIVFGGHNSKSQADSLTSAFLDFCNEKKKIIPKRHSLIRKAFDVALTELGLQNKVKYKRRSASLVYTGITLSTEYSENIKHPSIKIITLLKETPIFTVVNEKFEVTPFSIKNY